MRRLISACLLSLSLLAASAGALAQVGSEQQLKAAFIVNFLKYVEWPEANRGASICLFGRDTLGRRDRAGVLVTQAAQARRAP